MIIKHWWVQIKLYGKHFFLNHSWQLISHKHASRIMHNLNHITGLLYVLNYIFVPFTQHKRLPYSFAGLRLCKVISMQQQFTINSITYSASSMPHQTARIVWGSNKKKKKRVMLKGSLAGILFRISISMRHLARKDARGGKEKRGEMFGYKFYHVR